MGLFDAVSTPRLDRGQFRPNQRVAFPRGSFVGSSDKPRWYLAAAVGADLLAVAAGALLTVPVVRGPNPMVAALALAVLWVGARAWRGRYRWSSLGESLSLGALARDTAFLVGAVAIVCLALKVDVSRVGIVLALAPAPVVAVVEQRLLRRHLDARRRTGTSLTRLLLLGDLGSIDRVHAHLSRSSNVEQVVVGACPVGEGEPVAGPPVIFRLGHTETHTDGADIVAAAQAVGAQVVAVIPGPALHDDRVRRLTWAVHGAGLSFAVFPGVSEVAERRLDLHSVRGMTMISVAPPTNNPFVLAVKATFDRVVAAMLLVLLAPVIAVVGLSVRIGDGGPVFFRQLRIGRGGRPFTMWKFRTMSVNAVERRVSLADDNEQSGLMFKMRLDPRITRIGRTLRHYSIDELPQLVNVLKGEMSLVGPRPPLPEEVAEYDEVELRRLNVRPGMTGLWQVSGRSDLSWDETVRLDLRYVDNWSLGADADVMLRTVRTVVEGRGAY